MLKRTLISIGLTIVVVAGLVLIDQFSLLVAPCALPNNDSYNQESGHYEKCAVYYGFVRAGIELMLQFPAEAWTALATVAIAAFTWTLWRSNEKMWGVTLGALKVTQHAERARLFFSVANTGLILDGLEVYPTDKGILNCAFANVGRTPAILIEHFSQVAFETRRGNFPAVVGTETNAQGVAGVQRTTFPIGFIIAAEKDYVFTENTTAMPLNFGDQWHAFADAGERGNMFLLGYIRYEDVFGTRYIKGYCALFDRIGGERFVLMGGERYNYERTET